MGGEMRSGELAVDRNAAVRTFLDRIDETAKVLNGLDSAVVVTHHDCDGMTSGGIMAQALKRAQIPVETIALKQLYSEDVERLKKMGKWIIFTDFGSSYINQLHTAMGSDFIVIDHHQKGNGEHEYHVNPMEFGLDGGTEISAGGIAYLVAKAMSRKNRDLAALGVVGACGDMQDSRSNGLLGMNASILLNDGIEEGVLEVKTDLRLYGRISRPLAQYLMFSTSPILPELTANKDNCMRFLENLGIELQQSDGKWRSYEDLNPDEKKGLSTGLVMHLHEHNTPEWKLKELIGEVYTLTREERYSPLRDAKEFSTVLNACLVPGTEVYLNGKPTPIEKINHKTVFSVENNKIVRDNVVKSHQIPLSDSINVLEITTQTGRKVSLTQNHEIMSLDNGNITWTPAENLKKNDFVAVSKSIPDCSKLLQFWDFFDKSELMVNGNLVKMPLARKSMQIPVFNFDLGFLIGYIAGDGHIKKNNIGVDIAFSKKPRDLYSFEKIKSYFQNNLGLAKLYITDHPNCFNAVWNSSTFSTFIQRMGIPKGDKSKIVCLDPRLLEAEKPVIAGILQGLFSSDGNIYQGGVEFASHSEKMVNQMVYLLQRFGIMSHVNSRPCADCTGRKYRLLICGRTNVQKFVEYIGFPLDEINKFLVNRTQKMNPINSREMYLPVREKLLHLFDIFGVPTEWSAHFTYYKKGKQPSIENVQKYIEYFTSRYAESIHAIDKKDFKQLPKNLRFSKAKIARACGISTIWLLKLERGKVPGKNAQKKLENGFLFYRKKLELAHKLINEIQQFVDSDLYWDKIKEIHEITENRPEFVYDITVEKNHNYIANGIVVHNCGRNGASNIGFQVCMGDRGDYYQRALGLLQEHRRNLAEGIQLMQTQGLQEYKNYYFFDAEKKIKDSIVGIVAGMLYGSGSVKTDKPIVAFSRHEDGSIKVSARATTELVRNGVNLGLALRETCQALGQTAEGGGHCLHPNTMVQYANGMVKQIKEVGVGDQLLGKKDNFLQAAHCTNIFSNKKNEIVRLKTPIFEIFASKDHRFFVFQNFDIVEKKVKDISEGDFVLCVKKIDFKGKKIELENNPFVYLNEKGINLLKEKRKQLGLSRSEIIRQGNTLQRHNLYDIETFSSHRLQKSKLLEVLKILDIDAQNFLNAHVVKTLSCNYSFLDEKMAWLIGYIQGDGHIGKKRIECKEPGDAIITHFQTNIQDAFMLNTQIIDQQTYCKMRVYSADLCRFFEYNFPETKLLSGTLRIPEKIMMAENHILAYYLQGLFDADGGVYDRFIHLDLIDEPVLKGVQMLLLRFDIMSGIRKGGTATRLDITDFESIKKFYDQIGFTKNSKKQENLRKIIDKQQKKKRNSNIVSPLTYGQMRVFITKNKISRKIFEHNVIYKMDWKKHITYLTFIKKFMEPMLIHFEEFDDKQKQEIKRLHNLLNSAHFTFFKVTKKQLQVNIYPLIDLSVPENENFVANGFVVHNSIAAGCRIEENQKELFLQQFDKKLGMQLTFASPLP